MYHHHHHHFVIHAIVIYTISKVLALAKILTLDIPTVIDLDPTGGGGGPLLRVVARANSPKNGEWLQGLAKGGRCLREMKRECIRRRQIERKW